MVSWKKYDKPSVEYILYNELFWLKSCQIDPEDFAGFKSGWQIKHLKLQ